MTTNSHPSLNFQAAIELCGGKEDIAREIIQMLVNELPQQSQKLQNAFNQENWEEIDYLSHKLAGSAAYCGMDDIKAQARALNTCVRQKKFPEVASELQALQNSILAALAAAAILNITPQ